MSIDPVLLVSNECNTVMSAMRKNARWAHAGVASILGSSGYSPDGNLSPGLPIRASTEPKDPGDMSTSLISGFANLRAELMTCTDIQSVSLCSVLRPFLDVIVSQSTTGTITLAALIAVEKFFSLGVVTADNKDLRQGLQETAVAITHCRFEATDQAEDDAVLLKILALMEQLVSSDRHRELLPDRSVCEIVETCLSMACQMRRGDVLRRAAEMTMIKLTETVFRRLSSIDPESTEEADALSDRQVQLSNETSNPHVDIHRGSVIEDVGSNIKVKEQEDEETPAPSSDLETAGQSDESEKAEQDKHTSEGEEAEKTEKLGDTKEDIEETEPYGINAIREIFRVLISILDHKNAYQYTDSTRAMVLRLVNIIFEVSGKEIAQHPSLMSLTSGTLCKHLFQLARYDNPAILHLTLRAIVTIFQTCRPHLKLQLEFIFTYLLTCLSPVGDIPREPDVDAVFYEGVPTAPRLINPSRTATNTPTPQTSNSSSANLTKPSTPVPFGPNFMTMKSPAARETMVEALTSLVRSPRFLTDVFVNYDCDVDRADLCEDLIGFLCRSAYPDSATWSTPSVPPLCLEAILAFLASLSAGINTSYDEETKKNVEKVLETKAQKKVAISVTDSFNENPKKGLAMLSEKKIIPDDSPQSIAKFLKEAGRIDKKVLGEFFAKSANRKVMELFIELFDFSHKRLDEALREFLSSFRLPGESQQIEVIFEKFADQYCKGEGNTEEIANNDAAFVLSYAVIMLNTDQHSPQVKKSMTLDQFRHNLRGANDGKDFSPDYLEEIYRTIKSREIIMPDEHDNDETFEYAWKQMLVKISQAGDMKSGSFLGAFDKPVFETNWKPIITTLAYVFATATDDTVFSRVISGFDQAAKIASAYNIPGVIDHIIECLARMSSLSVGDLSAPTSNVEVEIEDTGLVTVSQLSVPFGSDYKAQMATVILFQVARSYASVITSSWDLLLSVLANLFLYNLAPPMDSPVMKEYGIGPIPPVKPQYSFKRAKGGREVGLLSTLSSYLTGYGDQGQEPSDEEVEATLSTIDCVAACGVDALYDIILKMDADALQRLIAAVVSKLPRLVDSSPSYKQSYYSTTLYFLELAVSLTVSSIEVARKTGPTLLPVLYTLNSNWEALDHELIGYTTAFALIVLQKLDDSYKTQLESHLKVILNMNAKVLQMSSSRLSTALVDMLKEDLWTRSQVGASYDFWQLLQAMCKDGVCGKQVLSRIKPQIEGGNLVTRDNFEDILKVLGTIANSTAAQAKHEARQVEKLRRAHRGKQADEKLAQLEQDVKDYVSISMDSLAVMENMNQHIEKVATEEDSDLYYTYIQALSRQCINPSRKVRTVALSTFDRVLLSPHLKDRPQFSWLATFEKALFPLIGSLLDPEVYDTDAEGMAITRLHVASLLCKVFLQYALRVQKSDRQELMDLWMKILETLDRLINSGQRDTLRESVVESLKNVLLVLQSSEFNDDDKLWEETWKRIDGFLPGLKEELPTKDSKPDAPAEADKPEAPKSDETEPAQSTETTQTTDEK
uniref:ARAD1B02926p n=1 Tax=Blastobotrys adeninivorans TaxID=409370 RepID=A0A060T9W3_BLAAD